MKKRKYTTINYKVRVEALPKYLQSPFEQSQQHLEEIRRIYRFVIDSRLFWRVWMIDEYQQIWVEVDFENEQGEDEYHTLVIDEGTYREVEVDTYEVIVE